MNFGASFSYETIQKHGHVIRKTRIERPCAVVRFALILPHLLRVCSFLRFNRGTNRNKRITEIG